MEYLYDGKFFGGKTSAREYAKKKIIEKYRNTLLRNAVSDSDIELYEQDNVWVEIPTHYEEQFFFRYKGVFQDYVLNNLNVLIGDFPVGIYNGQEVTREMYDLARKSIVYTIKMLFKSEYKQYRYSKSIPRSLFQLLNYPVKLTIREFNCKDMSGVLLIFICVRFKDGINSLVELRFFLDYNDYSITYKGAKTLTGYYASEDAPKELSSVSYKKVVKEEDVFKWAKYINSNYDFRNEVCITDYTVYTVNDEDFLFSGKNLIDSELQQADESIVVANKFTMGTSVDCFTSSDGVNFSYDGTKSKYGDVHMEKGETIKTGIIHVYKNKMGFVVISESLVIKYCLIEPVVNVNGETVLYGLKAHFSSKEDNSTMNKYIVCVTESLPVLQSILSDLDGKVYNERNYIKDLIVNSKYYRYAGLVGVRDCKFSTLFRFDDAVYAFIRYNGTVKLLFSRERTAEGKKKLVQNMKKILSIQSFRKLCIKKVYVYNIFSAESMISANLNIRKRFVGNMVNFDELLEVSKKEKDIVFSVSCINKETNKIESRIVVKAGEITNIDDIKLEC